MTKAIYFKIEEHLFYKIENGKGISVSIKQWSIKNISNLPTADIKKVSLITEQEYEKALTIVLSSLQ